MTKDEPCSIKCCDCEDLHKIGWIYKKRSMRKEVFYLTTHSTHLVVNEKQFDF